MELPDLISPVMAGPFFQALLKAAPGSLAMASPQPAVHASDMILALTHWLMGLLPAAAVLMIVYHALMKTLAQDEYTAAQHVKSIRSVVIGLIFGLGATGLVAFLINFVDPCSVTNGSDLNHLCRNPASAASGLPAGGPANKPRGSGDWWDCRAHNDDGTWQVNYKQNYKPECDKRTEEEVYREPDPTQRAHLGDKPGPVLEALPPPDPPTRDRPWAECRGYNDNGKLSANPKKSFRRVCDIYDEDPETDYQEPTRSYWDCRGYNNEGRLAANPKKDYKPECDLTRMRRTMVRVEKPPFIYD